MLLYTCCGLDAKAQGTTREVSLVVVRKDEESEEC